MTSIAKESLSEPSSARKGGLEHIEKLNILGGEWNYLDRTQKKTLLKLNERREDSTKVLGKLAGLEG